MHYITQVYLFLICACKIGDFKIAGLVYLQKKFVYILSYDVFFGYFFNYALKTK